MKSAIEKSEIESTKQTSNIRSFDNNRDAILALKRPQIDQFLDIKSRVGVLEDIIYFQDKINPLNVALADDLNVEILSIEGKIMKVIEQNQKIAVAELSELKRQYDHRFDLQIADNLRNVQHISTLKAENSQLRRKLDLTCKKLQRLQTEFDGGESTDIEQDTPDDIRSFTPRLTYNFTGERKDAV